LDSYEFNKIAGGVLVSALLIIGINQLSHTLISPATLAKNVFVVEGVKPAAAPAEGASAAAAAPAFEVVLAQASATRGEAVFKKCATCHTNDKGGPNKVGPNLYGIVGNKVGVHPGFSYSDGVAKHGGNWSFADLDKWLTSPKDFIAGTKMSFAGLAKDTDRADVILYLNSKSDAPLPLPKAEAPKAEAPKAEAPKAEAPKAGAPKAEAPKAEAPKADAPKAGAK
jgi:cytochrome c